MAIARDIFDDINSSQRMRYEYEAQKRMAYEQMRGMQNSLLGRAIGVDCGAEQQQAQKPVPPPEPNKVLLLLGEDE